MAENGLQAPPASVRNAPPILDVLARVLSPAAFIGRELVEIAAGSGYHAPIFARALPHLRWQPTDADALSLQSIAAHVAAAGLANLRTPLALDVTAATWPVTAADAILCINMIHISPWAATLGLFAGAARLMPQKGLVITYGPYSIDGDFQAESNVAFDQSLRARNSAWGIRDVKDVAAVAAGHGFAHDETVRMPANNLMLIFRKS
ncbi:MAG: DUF938 domain-containing protein [Rhodospirillaceae bacterium]|nr:DUF938 domain-containing protein [Rhodospirillaceae bacterium]